MHRHFPSHAQSPLTRKTFEISRQKKPIHADDVTVQTLIGWIFAQSNHQSETVSTVLRTLETRLPFTDACKAMLSMRNRLSQTFSLASRKALYVRKNPATRLKKQIIRNSHIVFILTLFFCSYVFAISSEVCTLFSTVVACSCNVVSFILRSWRRKTTQLRLNVPPTYLLAMPVMSQVSHHFLKEPGHLFIMLGFCRVKSQ